MVPSARAATPAASHSGVGTQSSSVKATISLAAAAQPALRAAAGPEFAGRRRLGVGNGDAAASLATTLRVSSGEAASTSTTSIVRAYNDCASGAGTRRGSSAQSPEGGTQT